MSGLFDNKKPGLTPLAERMRPAKLDNYAGQQHLLGEGRILDAMIRQGRTFSLILWGDPGCGKTTLAKIIAASSRMDAHFLSAVSAGVADVRRVIEAGKQNRLSGLQTMLFLDEIHRFNKAQQDAVLGAVESGDIVLIGATTENPSFSVISPLLSRSRVLKLNTLSENDLSRIFDRVFAEDEIIQKTGTVFSTEAKEFVIKVALGDARKLLNLVELCISSVEEGFVIEREIVVEINKTANLYDKGGERHYDTISAFIKSVRGSDPDAAVYYLARMIDGGEDPLFIARRMIILASEDVGNAAPNALQLAVAALTAVQNIGMPEARIVLSQCAIYLACAPKSNSAYLAIDEALSFVKEFNAEIPMHIRNAPTELMKSMGYGKGYQYPHDFPGHFINTKYLPDELNNKRFYRPGVEGSEKALYERMRQLWPERFNKEKG